MNCREFDALTTDRALDARAGRHAARCPRCAARLADHRRVAAALRALADEGPRQAPDRVEEKLRAAFRAAAPDRPVLRRPLAWGAWAAAAVLLAAGVWLSSPRPSQRLAPVGTAAAPPESVFIPLPGAPPLDGDLYVARIRAPRAALIAAGVPMNMERAGEPVHADVVFSLDGTPRAIRILHTHNRR